ncbi:hypothetical protein NFI96_025711, partial [Prochilodus magdalenae]
CRKMASISVDQDQFTCPVCLDLLKDPVAIPCGHSYCNVCINGCWDQEDQRGVYSCPQCRETFTPRPVLRRNNVIAEVVEKLKKTELRAAPPAPCYAGSGDVECDFCTGRKLKAVKSCLVCVASLCEAHLKPHLEIPALIKHKLVPASPKLQEKICSQHDKPIEIYCRTDHSPICYLCTMDKHRGHDTVAASAERSEKERKLKEVQMKSWQRIQEKEKELQEVKQAVNTLKSSAQAAVEDSERIFTQLIRSIEKKRSEVTELIRAQEKTELSRAEELLEKLEQEIADLKGRHAELEQLEQTEDHIQFLQSFQSVCVSSGSVHSPSVTVHQHPLFDGVRKSLSDLKERLEEFCKQQFSTISAHGKRSFLLEIHKDFCRLTLDPHTANYNLRLSEQNRVVTFNREQGQFFFSHPERFDYWHQVLSKESVSGRRYWEVEWSIPKGIFASALSWVSISVSYKGISRKGRGDECRFGHNSQSWSLDCSPSSLSFCHNNVQTKIKGRSSSRMGVYVDHSAGTLSFYSVSGTMTHLHTLRTTFTQPLYAGFGLSPGYSAKLFCERRKMAEASISVDQDRFSCPVCLELLKDPVAIPCGHSFCMVCIDGCWDQEDQSGVYNCPQCSETFTPRPVLRRNNVIAEVVEKLKKTEFRAPPPAPCYAGPGDVECDFCTVRKLKAVKSCLACVASLCEAHLKPHLEIPALIKHKLVPTSPQLQEKICSQHDLPIEIYCRTDHSPICYFCRIGKHRGHDTVSAEEERSKKERELKTMQKKSWQRLQKKEKELQEVKQAVNTLKSSAQAAVEDSERIFTQLIRSIEKKRSEVTELIRAQERTELSRAEELLEKLEQEIADLKRRDAELERLEQTEDHIQFLQSFQSLCVSSGSEDSPSITVHQRPSFDGVRKSLSDLKEQVEEFCKQEFSTISAHDFCWLTLDFNTANPNLTLSEQSRRVTFERQRVFISHPKKFDHWYQVLTEESVSGRRYWEVELIVPKGVLASALGWVYIAVSYKGISRKGEGDECKFGHNSQSWSLGCSPSALSFCHNNIQTEISAPPSSRIGVYVDHSAGTLSFYSVTDTVTLLHTVHTTFTQPLYAGIGLGPGYSVKLCDAVIRNRLEFWLRGTQGAGSGNVTPGSWDGFQDS